MQSEKKEQPATWTTHHGIEQKKGKTVGIELQRCQGCGRWVYVLTSTKDRGYMCGGCFNRMLRKNGMKEANHQ